MGRISKKNRITVALSCAVFLATLITAGCGGSASSATIPRPTLHLTNITVSPGNDSIPAGESQQFAATGKFSDGTSRDLTASVTWTSSAPATISVNSSGLAKANGPGTANISATSGNIGGSTSVTVSTADLVSLVIAPTDPSITVGSVQQFIAEGSFSDGTQKDMTASATWSSSNQDVSSISGAGLAKGIGAGQATIKAESAGISASTSLTVTAPELSSIEITPADPSLVVGNNLQLAATGTFSDGSKQDVTNTSTWSTSNDAIATVNAIGVVEAIAEGVATITAVNGSVTGSDNVTITPAPDEPEGIGWHALPPNTSLQASGACPPNGFSGDPYAFADNCANVVRTWSGAIADTIAGRLILWGGGHSNYYGNEIYSLNLTAKPITLTRLKDPTVPTNYANRTACVDAIPPDGSGSDSAPNSRESYGGLAFLPASNRMLILNGSLACEQGNGSHNTWTISLDELSNSSQWLHEDPTLNGPKPDASGGNSYGNITAFDPNSSLLFVADTSAIFTYDYPTNTYTRITTANGFVVSIYLSGAIDPTRKLFVLAGGCVDGSCAPGRGVFVADISDPASTTQQNWTTATMADPLCAEFLDGGETPIKSANPGITFDSVANDFVAWPNQGNNVYILTPDSPHQRLTCQKLTFAGGPPNSAHANNTPDTSYGTFGRFQYFATMDAFVLVNDWNIPAYLLRLR